MPIEFFVPGKPKTAGSKRPFIRGGRAIVVDDNEKTKGWQGQVSLFASKAYSGPLLEGPLSVTFVFFRLRPKNHFGTGRNADKLKDWALIAPTGVPDVLKLARAAEDALSGVVYKDDAQIVDEHLYDRYGPRPGLAVSIQVIGAVPVPTWVLATLDKGETK